MAINPSLGGGKVYCHIVGTVYGHSAERLKKKGLSIPIDSRPKYQSCTSMDVPEGGTRRKVATLKDLHEKQGGQMDKWRRVFDKPFDPKLLGR